MKKAKMCTHRSNLVFNCGKKLINPFYPFQAISLSTKNLNIPSSWPTGESSFGSAHPPPVRLVSKLSNSFFSEFYFVLHPQQRKELIYCFPTSHDRHVPRRRTSQPSIFWKAEVECRTEQHVHLKRHRIEESLSQPHASFFGLRA